MNDLISIIIPVYNSGNILFETLDSIKNNKYKNYEIIIVDDGSNEETKKILGLALEKYDNIYVYTQQNEGVSVARNFGVEKASGEYIIFMDSDDCIYNDSIEYLYNVIKKEDCDFVVGNYYSNYKNDFIIENNDLKKEVIVDDECLKYFLTNKNVRWSVWANIYKKDFVKDLKFPKNVKVAEDMYYNYQLYNKAKRIVMINKVVYFYRKNSDSVMNKNFNFNKISDEFEMINKVYNDNNSNDYLYFYCNKMLWTIKHALSLKLSNEDIKNLKKESKKFILKANNCDVRSISPKLKMEMFILKKNYTIFRMYSRAYMFLFKIIHK